jgi:pSer/pThr/pTyr-binding forkhead associated (FHA) protein
MKASEPELPKAIVVSEAFITLHLLDHDQYLPLAGKREFTVGRINPGQTILPDLHLGPYDAYQMGVSRIHAAIRVTGDQALVKDLGSANGTRVNGEKLLPHVFQPIQNGDLIALGKMRILAIFKK